jgi:predicted PurR-regulated permease PerM
MGFLILMGAQIRVQAITLVAVMPEVIDAPGEWLGLDGLGDWLDDWSADLLESSDLVANVANHSTLIFAVGVEGLVVLTSSISLAMHPWRYLDGLLMLAAEPCHAEGRETLEAVPRELRLWLVGQFAAMVMVGTLASSGLWLLGIGSVEPFVLRLMCPFLPPALCDAYGLGRLEGGDAVEEDGANLKLGGLAVWRFGGLAVGGAG